MQFVMAPTRIPNNRLDLDKVDCCPLKSWKSQSKDRIPCNETQGLCVDCQWADWKDWIACSVSCNGGTQSRTRIIQVQAGPEHQTKMRLGRCKKSDVLLPGPPW